MRKTARPIDGAVLLDTNHAAARYDLGTATTRRISQQIGATIRIGKLVRHDVGKLDAYFRKEGATA